MTVDWEKQSQLQEMKFRSLMMRSFLAVCLVCIIFLSSDAVYADCRGCCSWHGGVCCTGGITMCCDGTPLSDTCVAKGCNACWSSSDDGDDGSAYEETVTIKKNSGRP